jgi:hypothetical protein
MKSSRALLSLLLLAATIPAVAQEKSAAKTADKPAEQQAQEHASTPSPGAVAVPTHFYTLTYFQEELDGSGKLINTRRFETRVSASPEKPEMSYVSSANIQSDFRIPVSTGGGNQYSYMDVGADFILHRVGMPDTHHFVVELNCIVNSLEENHNENMSSIAPVLRKNSWSGTVELVVGGGRKVIFSSDDLASKNTLQIELAVTAAN